MMTGCLQIAPFFDHVAMVVFQTSATTLYSFTSPQDTPDFVSTAVNGIPFPYGETNTPAGLNLAYQALLTSNGGRPQAQKIVILLTDGQTTTAFRPGLLAATQALINANTTRVGAWRRC